MAVNILVVEDDKQTTKELRAVLRDKGYRVSVEMDSTSALEAGLAKKDTWDLAIIDLELADDKPDSTGYSGIKLIDELRKKRCKYPIIIYSGNTYYQVSAVDNAVLEAGRDKTVPSAAVTRIVNKPSGDVRGKPPNIEAWKRLHKDLLDGVDELTSEYTPPARQTVQRGPITLTVPYRIVRVRDKQIKLTEKQCKYLYELMRVRHAHVNDLIEELVVRDSKQGKKTKPRDPRNLVHVHIYHIRKELKQILRDAGEEGSEKNWPILEEDGRYHLPWRLPGKKQ